MKKHTAWKECQQFFNSVRAAVLFSITIQLPITILFFFFSNRKIEMICLSNIVSSCLAGC